MSPESSSQHREPYKPREGVDYIVDFYAVSGIEDHQLPQGDISREINKQIKLYHPDKFENVAEHFQIHAATMTRLLNRAKTILSDPEKRAEYDEILNNWTGLISNDGRPVYSAELDEQRRIAAMSQEEIEQYQESQFNMVAGIFGYDPARVEELQERIAELKEKDPNDQRLAKLEQDLLDALWLEDEMLSTKENLNREAIGIPTDIKPTMGLPGPEYVEEVTPQIQAAVEQEADARVERLTLESGAIATRLALLSGDQATFTDKPQSPELAEVDRDKIKQDLQKFADRALEASAKRFETAEAILETAVLIYPEEELQDELREKFIIVIRPVENQRADSMLARFNVGSQSLKEDHARALKFDDPEHLSVGMATLNEEEAKYLESKDYKKLIEAGYGVIIFEDKYKLDPMYLLGKIVDKYRDKYEPNQGR